MKQITLLIVTALISLAMTSCVENSSKYKALEAKLAMTEATLEEVIMENEELKNK